MASIRSIGVHKPAALQYLVAESILSEDCTERDYVWDTYTDGSPDGPTDEILTTEYHVVWSRDGLVRKIFNFEIEKEKVIQAVLTWFPVDEPFNNACRAAGMAAEYSGKDQSKSFLTQGTQPATDPNAPVGNAPPPVETRSRALVVFLRSQAHVFFLTGATHIVNLPFEVDRAFPAARGVVLQRKIAPLNPAPSSPKIPLAPPNSFLTNNQSFLSQTFSQSFTQYTPRNGSSVAASRLNQARQPGPAMFLEELIKTSAAPNTEGLPRIFSFTDPLSELGLVVNVNVNGERSSLLTIPGSGHRRLEPVDKAEEIVYVSPQNEVLFDRSGNDKPLLLVVTANHETNVFTIWSAAYLEPRSISVSRKPHVPVPITKSRRRSSHGTTAPGTGATTPATRGGDRLRESFGGPSRSKIHPPSFKEASQAKERLSDQAVEDVLASQLNPVSDVARQPRESRRVSSLLSRAELSTSFDKSAFQDLATHRTSLGGSFTGSFGASQRSRRSLGNDRTSLGGYSQSRHRASTPGSVASRMSMGASVDDTLEDVMDEDTLDMLEDHDELDDLFAPPDAENDSQPTDGLHKEMVMRVVGEIPIGQYLKSGLFTLGDDTLELQKHSKVSTLNAPFNSATLHERKLYLYISHPSLQHPLECEIVVTRKRLSPSASAVHSNSNKTAPRYACVPKFIATRQLEGTLDFVKIRDGQVERVAQLTSTDPRGSCLSMTAGWGNHLPTEFALGSMKLFDPYSILQQEQIRGSAGPKRTVKVSNPLRSISSSGPDGKLEIMDGDFRRHRMQICLSPPDGFVAKLFQVLSTVLPNHAGDVLLEIWWNIRGSLTTEALEQPNADWTAFVATLFTLAIPFVDEKTRKSNHRTRSSQRRKSGRPLNQAQPDEAIDDEDSAWHLMCNRQASQSHAKSWDSSSWGWVLHSSPASTAMSPPAKQLSVRHSPPIIQHINVKQGMLLTCIDVARQFVQTPIGKATNDLWRRLSPSEKQDLRIPSLSEIVVCLHLFREERKLDAMCQDFAGSWVGNLAPVIAQLGHWLRWDAFSWRQGGYYDLNGGSSRDWTYEDSSFGSKVRLRSQPWDSLPSVLEWLSTVVGPRNYAPFPTLAMLVQKSAASPHSSINMDEIIASVTPRTMALHKFFRDVDPTSSPRRTVELMERCNISPEILATLPEAAKAPLMEAITRCQANPPTTWSSSLLKLVQRQDLDLSEMHSGDIVHDSHTNPTSVLSLQPSTAIRDVHTICQGADRAEPIQSTSEVDRHYITRLIFREDRRYMEAYTLLEPLKQTVAEYRVDSRVDDAAVLEGQKIFMQWVMIRTFSLPIGSSMIKFSSKKPLLTEKYPLYGFSTSCLMKPMGNVVTAERQNYSEEKYFWAFFNAGVAAGLSISRDAQGIDTSWIMYNKPSELTNKHAGLLLGLGLNGHLRTIAKWLSFKYLTPKHTMTSVGLLLGLSASFMGTMDTLVTRLLSVHVTRMLPQGAAELNLSPYTQTTGLMGIGLLYYNTQHRRMSEVMLSEIEHVDVPDPSEPPDNLRDEAYRLAAGFALGYINLGKGKDLRGLRDMRIVERLMTVAVAPKSVDIVHILDQATAGAVIAITLIFMKTHDQAVARKVDIPDTLPQFDYVRPDIFLLRTLAKHMIMWDHIEANDDWIIKNLPMEYRDDYDLKNVTKLRSEHMPFYNILAGLLWSISLKHAGTGDIQVRNFLLKYLDQFIRINKLPALRYDSRLGRNTVRNCQDLLALSAATVMAGTGDLDIFRRLRGLHGRVGPESPYGSHLAAHMAFGTLFIAGGTQTFSRSNKAIASLICAFYPLFPMDVQDSRAHLQAFRHFWVLAAESRCLVVRDVDTGRAISMPITVHLKANDETKNLVAPCLLPEVQLIARIQTADITYWPTTLDFVHNPIHRRAFNMNQTLIVRRRSAHDTYTSTFSATLVALNDAQSSRSAQLLFHWLFSLPSIAAFVSESDAGLVLPVDPHSKTFLDSGATVIESRLVLGRLAKSWKADELRELRGVFEWAEGAVKGDGRLRWLGKDVVEGLKAGILERGRGVGSR
ncbi:negative regulator of mitosis [Dothidotthia symphoricarpi CBS 119687]|uniref:Negative regulator of mitosis n=1 Tax=Dothidotthia symphoricarpi CBS 119687 TaxID=1392245 RepID=A0A6A6ADR3_9PLEO|nr:negative regulator of mitosis [Dothidotthia symphoricarpi CBS 119687]KAF2130032.1 negative regulator of mitosis [Dothidotthia symphoricarpi CBS 119687]